MKYRAYKTHRNGWGIQADDERAREWYSTADAGYTQKEAEARIEQLRGMDRG